MQAKPAAPNLADLLAAASSPSPTPAPDYYPPALSPNPANTGADKKPTSPSAPFLQKKWPLFSCQPFIIYLQGPTILPPIPAPSNNPQLQRANEDSFIAACLLAAKAKRNGHGRMAPFSTTLLSLSATMMEGRSLLYTDPVQHKAWLAALISEGVSLQTSKVASRTTLLATLEAFSLAQSEYIEAEGWPSVAAYLKAKAGAKEQTANKLTALELEQALLDL